MLSSWREMKIPPLTPTATAFLEHSSVRRVGGWIRQRAVLIGSVFAFICIFFLIRLSWTSSPSSSSSYSYKSDGSSLPSPFEDGQNGTFQYIPPVSHQQFGIGGHRPRYVKVSLSSGFEDVVYERGLESHVRHAHRHGYPIYIAREQAAPGMFNKIAFILNVLMTELYKPADERADWIFYFDADSILMNQELPLEIFDTPDDYKHINWIAAKDWNGLNAGVFLLRVCPWSVDLLTRVMTYKLYHPDETYTFEEQTILARLTEDDVQFKGESVYVPKTWINAYFYLGSDVVPGALLSHFPHPDYKWHMYTWLKAVDEDYALLTGEPARPLPHLEPPSNSSESQPERVSGNIPPVSKNKKPIYHIPVENTRYPAEIKQFWKTKRRLDAVLKGFQRNENRKADPIEFGLQHEETKKLATAFKEVYDELKQNGPKTTDKPDELVKMIEKAEEAHANLISGLMQYFESHEKPPGVAGFW